MHRLATKATIRSVTDELLESIPVDSEFSANELHNKVRAKLFRRTGEVRHPFPDTILRYLRYARVEGEYDFKCISREKSLYKKERA